MSEDRERCRRPPMIAALLVTLFIGGCIVLPVPIPPTGMRVDEAATKLVIGTTTRAEVHALLGPPNRLATDRHELWGLERDPAHMLWIVIAGGPGYATGGGFRTGEAVGYVLHVRYDRAGLIAGWQWRTADGHGQSSEAKEPSSPFVPIRRLDWQAVQVVAVDDAALIVSADQPHRLTIERLALADGRRLGSWTGDPAGCRLPVGLRPGRAMVFGLVDGALVTVPPGLTAAVVPCRWELRADGTMVATRLPDFASAERTSTARLAGDRVVRHDGQAGLTVLSLAGETLLRDGTVAGRPEAIAVDAAGDRLLVRSFRAIELEPDFRLLQLSTEQVWVLSALGAAMLAGGCVFTLPERLALTPDGRKVAIGCAAHVQVWTLGDDFSRPTLEAVLPTPPGFAAAHLAFSRDGSRLVLGADGIALWRTDDWSLQAFLPGPELAVVEDPAVLVLTPDGSGLATVTGFWQLVPSPADPAG